MKQKIRMLDEVHLSEISFVDHPACEKATLGAVTAIPIAKRSESVNEFDFNDEALRAADIKPEEAGALRKVFNFLFKKPVDRNAELRKTLLEKLQSEPDVTKWGPMLQNVDGVKIVDVTDQSHGNLAPSDGTPPHPGSELDATSAAGGKPTESRDNMGDGETRTAMH